MGETMQRRQNRVKRNDIMKDNDNDNNNKIGDNDKNAVKILQNLRNKKVRKKPKLAKAKTIGANFGEFYLEKHSKPKLEKTGSSFLLHREKCVQKAKISESKSKAP